MILQDPVAFFDQSVAHIPGETADVRLLFGQAEDILHPAVGVLLRKDPVFPDPVKGLVSTDPFVSQFTVGEGAERYQSIFVDTDIGVAFGIVLADIQVLVSRFTAVDITCIPQDSCAAAVGTSDGFFLHFVVHLSINRNGTRLPARALTSFIGFQGYFGSFFNLFCTNSYQNGNRLLLLFNQQTNYIKHS